LGREIEDQIALVAVEAALGYARTAYAAAYRQMNQAAAAIDGVHAELRADGMRNQQWPGGGLGEMRALESLEKQLRALRTELAADHATNLEPARRLLETLNSDPAAELEP
jgi:hypothetical protein